MTKIAVLGLGAMGSRMALRLIEAGHDVVVWNRTSPDDAFWIARGAQVAASPQLAAEGSDIVMSMVRDNDASRAVWLDPAQGALLGLRPGALAIDCSTVTPNVARGLYAACSAAGVDFLDAPVIGSRPQAETGQLIFLVGGDAGSLERARPILAAIGGAIHHLGAAGSGAAVKLMVNALFGIQVAAIAELIGAFAESGVDMEKALDIIATTPVASPALKGAIANIAAGHFAPLFPVHLVEKDFGYAHDVAAIANAHIPLVDATRAVFARAIVQGFGDDNLTGIVRLYRTEKENSVPKPS